MPSDTPSIVQSGAQAIIDDLGLLPHPEGGWYRETWRAEAAGGERGSATAIYFLLEGGQQSHWHRVDAAELWLGHTGSPLALRSAASDGGPVAETRLGPDIIAGERPQQLIPPRHWQVAQADRGWALVS